MSASLFALPAALVQIQCATGLGLNVRITREDPKAMFPRGNRVLVQSALDGAMADARHQSRALVLVRRIDRAQPDICLGAAWADSFFQARQPLIEGAIRAGRILHRLGPLRTLARGSRHDLWPFEDSALGDIPRTAT